MLWVDRMKSRPVLLICAVIVVLYSGFAFINSLQRRGAFPLTAAILFLFAVLLTFLSGFIGKKNG